MPKSRYKIRDTHYPYFITATIVEWLPLFTDPKVVQFILDSMLFMQEQKRIVIYAYVIMENHLHMILSSPHLSSELGKFKSFTARQIIDFLENNNYHPILDKLRNYKLAFKTDRTYQCWQEGSHPKQISSREMMIQKIEYIHYNPVRRGYVDNPIHWRYSSARDYENQTGLIPINKDW